MDAQKDQPVQSTAVQPATVTAAAVPKEVWWKKVTRGTKQYAVELVLAVTGLLVTFGAINYGIYAFVNYLKGVDGLVGGRVVGEFGLWLVALMLIWAPLTLFFYLRVHNEGKRYPERATTWVHKLLSGLFVFLMILTIAGTVFLILYTVLRSLVGGDPNSGDVWVRFVLPAVLATAVNVFGLGAFGYTDKIPQRLYVLILIGISAVVIGALLYISTSTVRGVVKEQRTVQDLEDIRSEVSAYYQVEYTVPDDLSDLSNLKKQTKDNLSSYTYKKVGATKYQLCADFMTDTTASSYRSSSQRNDYSLYNNFSNHGKGKHCFKLATSVNRNYFDDTTSNDYDGLFDGSDVPSPLNPSAAY